LPGVRSSVIGEDGDEFISTEPNDLMPGDAELTERVDNAAEQFVTRAMAEVVVHHLQTVDVDVHDAERLLRRPSSSDLAIQTVEPGAADQCSGEVVEGQRIHGAEDWDADPAELALGDAEDVADVDNQLGIGKGGAFSVGARMGPGGHCRHRIRLGEAAPPQSLER